MHRNLSYSPSNFKRNDHHMLALFSLDSLRISDTMVLSGSPGFDGKVGLEYPLQALGPHAQSHKNFIDLHERSLVMHQRADWRQE